MNVMQNRNSIKQTNAKNSRFKRRRLNFKLAGQNDDNPDQVVNRRVLNELSKTDGGIGNATRNTIRTTNNVTSSTENHTILAIAEGRGHAKGEVGMAAIDVNSPKLILCQISDNLLYSDSLTKIQILNPSVILLADTMFELKPLPQFVEFIKDSFPSVQFIPIQRRHFNDKKGIEALTELASRLSQNILQIISRKYYSLSAAAALLEYLKNIYFMTFVKACLKIEYQTKFHGIFIDINTSIRLELLYSLSNELTAIKRFSLFNMLNYCITRIGKRHLRAQILEPSCNIEFIRNRQEQIKVLLENRQILDELTEKLITFRSVDQLLKISCISLPGNASKAIETNIQLALLLKQCLEGVQPLNEVIQKTVSESFEKYREILQVQVFKTIIETIDQVLQCDIHKNNLAVKHFQHIYAIKPGNATIDNLRGSYKEVFDQIQKYFTGMCEQTHLPLKLLHTTKYGHHFQLKNPKSIELPENLRTLCKRGSTFYLTTSFLLMMNERSKTIADDIIKISNQLICEMLMTIAQQIEPIHQLIGVIIDLDIIQSLTESSSVDNFCCPKFGKVLKLEKAFHPLLNITKNENDIVVNNVIATPQFNFYLIHGPNMSGKTVYIKMIAIIQIMAQIGCFVPGTSAELRIVDRIFSRLGFQDNLEQKASSFTVELREMEFIYRNLTANSLVIMDELCRSCNPQEGEMICWKFCEKLLAYLGISEDDYFKARDDETDDSKKSRTDLTSRLADTKLKDVTRPFIFLTTHFESLHKLSERFLNFTNLHMEVKEIIAEDKTRLEYTYRIKSGITKVKNYGLAIAKLVRFPSRMLERAEEVIEQIQDESMLMNESVKTRKQNETIVRNDVSVNQTLVLEEMPRIEKDIFEIFSLVLMLMSRADFTQPNPDSHNVLKQINKRLEALAEKMTPELKAMIEQSALTELINALNGTRSSSE